MTSFLRAEFYSTKTLQFFETPSMSQQMVNENKFLKMKEKNTRFICIVYATDKYVHRIVLTETEDR